MTDRDQRRVGLVLLLGLVSACQERLVDSESEDRWKVCTVVNSAFVFDEQGDPVSIVEGPNGGRSFVCLCLTIDEKKSGDYDEYFNDEALRVCLENATRMGYPEANDCAYWHDEGQWIEMISVGPLEDDVRCEQADPVGCSVR